MFITGPQVIKQVTGEEITAEALGGADAHMTHSGVIHFVAEDDEEAILSVPAPAELSARRTIWKSRRVCRPTTTSIPIPR